MNQVSRLAFASVALLLLTGPAYLLGRFVGDRMDSAGQGWEMAFCWSPIVFIAIDGMLVLAAIAAIVGLFVGPGVHRRVQSTLAGLACASVFLVLPWR